MKPDQAMSQKIKMVPLGAEIPPELDSSSHQSFNEDQVREADSLGEVIATRRFHFTADDNSRKTISVLLGKPRQSPGASEFCCPFQVVGLGNEQTQLAQGHDSMQALQSALILIGANLNHLNDKLGRRLTWDPDAEGDVGFP